MSLYKILLLVSFLFINTFELKALAQEESSQPTNTSLMRTYIRKTIAVSYISWTELVDFESASTTDKGFANFFGNALSYEMEVYKQRRTGFAYEADLLFGQANVGGTQSVLTYQESYKKFTGLMLQARYAYRLNSVLTFSLGPLLLARQMSAPDVNGVSAKVGNPVNYGLIGTIGAKLGSNLELRQSLGTMSFKASTIWSLGLGYKY